MRSIDRLIIKANAISHCLASGVSIVHFDETKGQWKAETTLYNPDTDRHRDSTIFFGTMVEAVKYCDEHLGGEGVIIINDAPPGGG